MKHSNDADSEQSQMNDSWYLEVLNVLCQKWASEIPNHQVLAPLSFATKKSFFLIQT
jgi:hypothetical protein